MSLAKKLNLPKGTKLRVVGEPKGVVLDDVETTSSGSAPGVLVFVTKLAEVDTTCAPVIEAARWSAMRFRPAR